MFRSNFKRDRSTPDPCMQLPNTTTRLTTLEITVLTTTFEQRKKKHVRSTMNNVQPTMLPIYQILAYASAFNYFKVYMGFAHITKLLFR